MQADFLAYDFYFEITAGMEPSAKSEDPEKMSKKTYTLKEVARMIEHDSSTVSRWCQEGKIAAKKPFGRWVITRGALLVLLFAFGLLSGEGLREYQTMLASEELHARQALVGQDAVRKALGGENDGEATNHRFRHSFASNLIRAGANVKVVQKLMRHATVQMTLNAYAHLLGDDLESGIGLLTMGK